MEELQFLLEQLNKYGSDEPLTVHDLKVLIKAAINKSRERGNDITDITR